MFNIVMLEYHLFLDMLDLRYRKDLNIKRL